MRGAGLNTWYDDLPVVHRTFRFRFLEETRVGGALLARARPPEGRACGGGRYWGALGAFISEPTSAATDDLRTAVEHLRATYGARKSYCASISLTARLTLPKTKSCDRTCHCVG